MNKHNCRRRNYRLSILKAFWDRLKVSNGKFEWRKERRKKKHTHTTQSDEISKIKRSILTSEWHIRRQTYVN